ncbi:GntR family transcriptional regulator [Paraburkholderia sp. RL17-337-BIB-A]|uniref:GntR family transcriptional regulator n=1 Tax=Paraburkholderia sp. RL17-337-BIB-A TaxID=3031636 RepID=UPI0038BAB018
MKAKTEDLIYEALSTSLLTGQLQPGTQLVETRIANIFGVSRERVRKVLQRLGHERLIEVIAHRGAFVSHPSLSQAREIYEARRIIEGGVASRLAGRLTPAQVEQLRVHSAHEIDAIRRGDRALSIQLSSRFHHLLATFCANPFVTRELEELVSRILMLEAFFVAEPGAASQCSCDEHRDIVDALIDGDTARAVKSMHVHLSMIETRLQPEMFVRPAVDPDVVLQRAWDKVKSLR